MHKTCSSCGNSFSPAFVFQVAVTPDHGRRYFCTLDCRKAGLGVPSRVQKARKVAILNQKGGTGKTTTSVNVSAGLAEKGNKVLLVDTDAQGNVGVSLGISGEKTLYHSLVEGADIDDVAVPVRQNLDVITAGATLAAAEIWLARQNGDARSKILTRRFNRMMVGARYDYVILDCGPSLNLLNQNALSFVDEVVVPVACDYLALVGVKQVLQTIRDVERHLKHTVEVAGVLPTFFDGRTRLAREVLSTLKEHFQDKCLAPIRLNTRLAEAPSHKKTIFEYAPYSKGAEDYGAVVNWMTRNGHAEQQQPTNPKAA